MKFENIKFKSVNGVEKDYQLIPDEKIPKGGYGIVVKIFDKSYGEDNNIIRAAKILKPEHVSNKKVQNDFLDEIKMLSKLNHPNIIKIYDWGIVNFNETESLYYIMDYISGGNIENIIESNINISQTFFENLVVQMLTAILVCQNKKIAHLDIKPDNILVNNAIDYNFILTDFGKAKIFQSNNEGKIERYDTVGGGILEYVHPDLRPYLRKNKVPIELFQNAPIFDLFSIGIVLHKVYSKVIEFTNTINNENPWYLFINDLCYDIEEYNFCSYRFKNAEDALIVAKRLINSKEVESNSQGLIRLSKHESINFTKEIKKYVDTYEFQRLRKISQLGTTEFIFPSARHTRFEHSLGAYYKSLSYIQQLNTLPIFNYLFNETDIKSVSIAALLHDIGHYPFAHFLEEIPSLKVDLDLHHENYSKRILKGEIDVKFLINSKYSKNFFSDIQLYLLTNMIPNMNFIKEVFSQGVNVENLKKIYDGKGKYKVLKKIVDGPIDCDKLDYLARDSSVVGVSYGDIIDLDRFYKTLTLNVEKKVGCAENYPQVELALNSKGKSTIESVFIARYQLFSEVYWHKTCRAITSMIKDAFWHAHTSIEQCEMDWAVMLLGDSDFLRWIATKIEDKDVAIDLLGGLITNNRIIYKRIRTYSHLWEGDDMGKKNTCKNLYDKLNSFEQIFLYKSTLVDRLNSYGNVKCKNWINIKKHQILFDIPNNSIDVLDSVKIKYSSSITGKKVYDIKEISEAIKSFHKAEDIKKIRLFCHPTIERQLLILENKLDEIILETINRFKVKV